MAGTNLSSELAGLGIALRLSKGAIAFTNYSWYYGKVKPMPLSGKEMLRLYLKAGWTVLRQSGSHVRVRRGSELETIPMHKELKRGMEAALLKRLRQKEEK